MEHFVQKTPGWNKGFGKTLLLFAVSSCSAWNHFPVEVKNIAQVGGGVVVHNDSRLASAAFTGGVEFDTHCQRFARHEREFRFFEYGAVAGGPDVGDDVRMAASVGDDERVEQDGALFKESEANGVAVPGNRGAGYVAQVVLQGTCIINGFFAVGLVELFKRKLHFLVEVGAEEAYVFEETQLLFGG